MKIKDFFKPTKWKIIIFLILFIIIYLIPYIKIEINPNIVSMVASGRYSIIFGFMISLASILSGTFILNDILVFASFIVSFIFVYMLSCSVVCLIHKKF